jgi:spermidine dehydrogenase
MSDDRALGMEQKITRRDFLDGVAIAVGGSVLASGAPWVHGLRFADSAFAPEKDASYYPPALMGMRGNHEGTYSSAQPPA